MSAPANKVRSFGTAPVFFTAISTILGAILFLRFGFAVGQTGFFGTLLIIAIGHIVTIPTAMAIAEIATNQRVEGGGEYYIISRSFGLVIGSTIGVALFMSQAISVAFYVMAFSEAITPLIDWTINTFALPDGLVSILSLKQTVGIPALLLLTYVMLTRGANLGVKLLYIVVATLAISIGAFFVGQTNYSQQVEFDPNRSVPSILEDSLDDNAEDTFQGFEPEMRQQSPQASTDQVPDPVIPISFFTVFAIIFPAFTGMTAGVGLSGDLKEPGKSIPLGTMAATLTGMVVYVLIAWKLTVSMSPIDLADTSRLVMADIAWQGWLLIPLGLAAATISSALGSVMVAPRTLQAIAKDKIFPAEKINRWIASGRGAQNEPFNASIITIIIAAFFIVLGAIDSVAKIISMFFMVTYGSLCLISFLNHFSADPAYRPRFRSRWYISLFGAVACIVLMFLMNPFYAFLAIVMVALLFLVVSYFNKEKQSLAAIFQGVLFQIGRQLHVFLQKADKEKIRSWRPSAIALSENSFKRLGLFDMLSWISYKYGFGTYIHLIKGYLSRETHQESFEIRDELIQMSEEKQSNIIVDTIVSPSYTSTIAQVIQLPGIAGTENNLILLEFSKHDPSNLDDIVDNLRLMKAVNFDIAILASSDRGFGMRKHIHVWITRKDYDNANLMILFAYILLGHKDWKHAEIKIFAIHPERVIEEERQRISKLIKAGQLPISAKNIQVIPYKENVEVHSVIHSQSKQADLTIIGFQGHLAKSYGIDFFLRFDDIGNVLFVDAAEEKNIIPGSDENSDQEQQWLRGNP